MTQWSTAEVRAALEDELRARFGISGEDATDGQAFEACAIFIRETMARRLAAVGNGDKRQVHYLSMEFLLGRSLEKNAYNLGLLPALAGALEGMGKSASDIFECEPDAGLGNGGLGRLAACYMDSCATLDIPCTGYSLCYELGIFRQKIEAGKQVEAADNWLPLGGNWLVCDYDEAVEVRYGGRVRETWDYFGKCHAELADYTPVLAVPRDMLLSGFGSDRVNRLRLWEAKSPNVLDMSLFSGGRYIEALAQRTMAEVITKVLYPADDHMEGKTLRLKQQYFFVSATAQDIVRKHRRKYGDVKSFAQRHVLQINDTHPALIIPELMRIFMDEDDLGWTEAWEIVSACVAYTNHTVMTEALESWPVGLVQELLPRVWQIIQEIDNRRLGELERAFGGGGGRVEQNLVVRGGQVSMPNLCLAACFKINGVSALHGEILKNELFRDANALAPERFLFITNGVDHRRWLSQINPRLHGLLAELLGGEGYLREPELLCKLNDFRGDAAVLSRLTEIKGQNKLDFAEYMKKTAPMAPDPGAVFDVQVKRLHEYKRQLLCAMLIAELQNRLRDDPGLDFRPRTFIFGAKAASGYTAAKRIISLLCALSEDIAKDPACRGKLSVIFLENYRVSLAEKLMPAAQVSEQISAAGKEASGTGNMKLMANGAVTIGTLDGANVEMYGRLGDENMFLFGLRAGEAAALRARGYDPGALYRADGRIRRVLDRFAAGLNGEPFPDLVSRLLNGDEYMLLADFDSYLACHDRLYAAMDDKKGFAGISLKNIAESGRFAADRAVREYAERIWGVPSH